MPTTQTGDNANAAPGVDAELERQTAQVHRDLAAGLEDAGAAEAAVAELEAAIEADGRARAAEQQNARLEIEAAGEELSGRSYGELERLCKRNDPPAQAVRACTLVIAPFRVSAGRLPELLTDRGDAYRALGDPERAVTDYNAALNVDSSFSRALLARARVHAETGALREAARDFNRAITAGEAGPGIRTERAEVLMADGRPAQAIREYDRILWDQEETDAHNAAYLGRAWAHCEDGQEDAAAVDWQVWLAGGPGDDAPLAVPLLDGGYLAAAEARPLVMDGPALAALRAWTADGCPAPEEVPKGTAEATPPEDAATDVSPGNAESAADETAATEIAPAEGVPASSEATPEPTDSPEPATPQSTAGQPGLTAPETGPEGPVATDPAPDAG